MGRGPDEQEQVHLILDTETVVTGTGTPKEPGVYRESGFRYIQNLYMSEVRRGGTPPRNHFTKPSLLHQSKELHVEHGEVAAIGVALVGGAFSALSSSRTPTAFVSGEWLVKGLVFESGGADAASAGEVGHEHDREPAAPLRGSDAEEAVGHDELPIGESLVAEATWHARRAPGLAAI